MVPPIPEFFHFGMLNKKAKPESRTLVLVSQIIAGNKTTITARMLNKVIPDLYFSNIKNLNRFY
jgi:hypothetical protein